MRRSHALTLVTVLLVCLGCDQVTKQIAEQQLSDTQISLLGDTVRLAIAHNEGAFLGFGGSWSKTVRSVAFVLVVPLLLGGVCYAALRSGGSPWTLLGVGMVLGGGLSNWLDRVLHRGVVLDFLNVGIGPLRTGIFNVADTCILAGIGLLLLRSLTSSRQ